MKKQIDLEIGNFMRWATMNKYIDEVNYSELGNYLIISFRAAILDNILFNNCHEFFINSIKRNNENLILIEVSIRRKDFDLFFKRYLNNNKLPLLFEE